MIAVVILNQQNQITYWSPAAENMLGFSVNETLGQDIWQLLIPHQNTKAQFDDMKRMLSNGDNLILKQTIEISALCRNGDLRPLELALCEHGRETHKEYILIIQDNSEHKQAQEEIYKLKQELEARKSLLQGIVNTNMIGVIFTDISGNVTDANDIFLSIIGYKPAEVPSGQVSWSNIIPHESLQQIQNTIQDLAKTGVTKPFEKQLIHKKGHRIDVLMGCSHFESSTHEVVCLLCDKSAKNQAEEALTSSNQRFEAIFEHTSDYMFIIDNNRILIDVNQAVCQLFKLPKEQILGKRPREFIDLTPQVLEPDMPTHWDIWDLEGNFNKLYNYGYTQKEFSAKLPDGSVKALELFAYANITPGYHLLVAHDITEHIKRERELKQAQILSERANRQKNEFLSIMTHELRTPLNAIIGYTEMLESFYADSLNEKQLKYVQNIGKSGEHLLDLVNNMLEVSAFGLGQMEFSQQSIELPSLINSIYTAMEERAHNKQVQLFFDIASDIDKLQADPIRLKQILCNLLNNAIKFNKEGGSVYLKVFKSENNQRIVFEIKDTGIGIPEDKLPEIFKPFSQIDTSYSRKAEGTGIGLALAKHWVESHGGSITVESREGAGSIFTFTLPLHS